MLLSDLDKFNPSLRILLEEVTPESMTSRRACASVISGRYEGVSVFVQTRFPRATHKAEARRCFPKWRLCVRPTTSFDFTRAVFLKHSFYVRDGIGSGQQES